MGWSGIMSGRARAARRQRRLEREDRQAARDLASAARIACRCERAILLQRARDAALQAANHELLARFLEARA